MSWRNEVATERHFEAIRDLFFLTHGYRRPVSFDRWKLFSTDFGRCPLIVAMQGDRCVGLYTVLPTPLILDGVGISGAQSVDTMTHPDFRGRGMFLSLARSCYEEAANDIAVMYGLPNENSYPGFIKHLGWMHLDDITRWVRPLAVPRRLPRLVAALADPLIKAVTGLGEVTGSIGATAVADMPSLSAAIRPAARCFVEKSARWLTWRYAADAGSAFRRLTIGQCETPDGLIVFEELPADDGDSRHSTRIMEWLGRTAEAKETILRQFVRAQARRGCRSISYVTNDPRSRSTLRRNLFFERGRFPLIAKALNAAATGTILAPGDMIIQGGDMD
ncbi:MAG: GNAT family N-acetyltransferase [Aliidongia sp.]